MSSGLIHPNSIHHVNHNPQPKLCGWHRQEDGSHKNNNDIVLRWLYHGPRNLKSK